MKAVLDASAILALLWDEPGAEKVAAVLDDAAVSAVNWAEVMSKLQDRGIDLETANPMLKELPVAVLAFDADQAFATGALRKTSKHLGLSLGDRACLALAAQLKVPAYTADRAWAKLDSGVEVVVVR